METIQATPQPDRNISGANGSRGNGDAPPECSTGKKPFADREEAELFEAENRMPFPNQKKQYAYRCEHCQGYHLDTMSLYCVLIPTHRNPTGGWLDFKWRRRFDRRHDEAIMKNVAILHGGYTFLPRSEGGWMNGPDHFQIEGMRPFLFTAETQEKANIIADLICIHYEQITVMTAVWAQNVQFRERRELIPFFTNMLSRPWTQKLRKELPAK